MSSSYQDLRVWHEGMKLATDTYKTTATFPKNETYGLSQQMRRAAVSIPSNIAEGKGHHSNKEFVHFLFSRKRVTVRTTDASYDSRRIRVSFQGRNVGIAEPSRNSRARIGRPNQLHERKSSISLDGSANDQGRTTNDGNHV